MFWEEDNQDNVNKSDNTIVDISFKVNCKKIAADHAYSLFEDIGILSKTAGNKFRKEILSRGGSRSAMDSFIAFRGRKPKIDALLFHHGLTN